MRRPRQRRRQQRLRRRQQRLRRRLQKHDRLFFVYFSDVNTLYLFGML